MNFVPSDGAKGKGTLSSFTPKKLNRQHYRISLEPVSFNEQGYVLFDDMMLFKDGRYYSMEDLVSLAFENGSFEKTTTERKKF